MSKLIRKFTVPLALTAAALVAALLVASVSASPKSSWSPARGVTAHRVNGCGAPITVYSPTKPGAPLNQRALGLPAGPGTIAAQANAHHVLWLKTITCRSLHRRAGLPPRPRADNEPSENWAGYQDYTLNRGDFAQAHWKVRGIGEPNLPTKHDYSVYWPGIGSGAGHSDELVQDGTEGDVSLSRYHGVQHTYFFWLEYFPGEYEQEVTNLIPKAWDQVGTEVAWGGKKSAFFLLCDYTKHKCVDTSQNLPGMPGYYAEWIVERPCVNIDPVTGNGTYPSLAPFGTQTFRTANWEQYGQSTLRHVGESPYGRDKYWMQEGKSLLAGVYSITNGGSQFQVKWDTYGSYIGCKG